MTLATFIHDAHTISSDNDATTDDERVNDAIEAHVNGRPPPPLPPGRYDSYFAAMDDLPVTKVPQ